MTIYKIYFGTDATDIWVAGQITKIQSMDDDTLFVADPRADEDYISETLDPLIDPEPNSETDYIVNPTTTPVRTSKTDLSSITSIDTLIIDNDGVDAATISAIPNGAVVFYERLASQEETWEQIPNGTITDGSIVFTSVVQMQMRFTVTFGLTYTTVVYEVEVTA